VDVDPKNMIPEFNETNNSSGNIKLVPRCIVQTLNKLPGIAISRPDLIIKSFSRYPENPTVTDEMVFTITIKNVGPGNSKACKLKVKVGGEGSPPRFDLPALAPGATYALRRHITLPVAQNYLSTVKIDDDDQNAETDETNNEQEMMFTVTPPPRPAGMGSDHSKH
jgi:subtilase family serine protease